ncbi:uncharacterized protein [Antedon mediterranea]|uniref:uncharacterized protein n=1 Tax=Antedon mediterranea TaxID=105859 RepID=UPI003AF87603
MTSETSVAVSDLVVTLSAVGPVLALAQSNKYASAGFLLVAAASSLGIFRFGLSHPGRSLIYFHDLFTWVSKGLGMSLLATGFFYSNNLPTIGTIHLVSAIIITIVRIANLTNEQVAETATEVVMTSAVVSFLLGSLYLKNPFAILGTLLYAISGLVGTDGDILQVKRVNWFHYIFAFGTMTLMKAYEYENS